MKRLLLLSIVLISSIQQLHAMRGGRTMPISNMLEVQAMHDQMKQEILSLINNGNLEGLRSILKKSSNYQRSFFNDRGVYHAMKTNQLAIIKLLLQCGVAMPQVMPICSQDAIRTLFTHSTVRPSDYDLNTAYKRTLSFLCSLKRKNFLLPKEVRLLILEQAHFLGDLMVARLRNTNQVTKGFLEYAKNRLLECTIHYLHTLETEDQNIKSEYKEVLTFKTEILNNLANRITVTPFICNAKEQEPKTNKDNCVIL